MSIVMQDKNKTWVMQDIANELHGDEIPVRVVSDFPVRESF